MKLSTSHTLQGTMSFVPVSHRKVQIKLQCKSPRTEATMLLKEAHQAAPQISPENTWQASACLAASFPLHPSSAKSGLGTKAERFCLGLQCLRPGLEKLVVADVLPQGLEMLQQDMHWRSAHANPTLQVLYLQARRGMVILGSIEVVHDTRAESNE